MVIRSENGHLQSQCCIGDAAVPRPSSLYFDLSLKIDYNVISPPLLLIVMRLFLPYSPTKRELNGNYVQFDMHLIFVKNCHFRCQARARYNTAESMRNIFVTYPYHNHGIDE